MSGLPGAAPSPEPALPPEPFTFEDCARFRAARSRGATPEQAFEELARGLSDVGRARFGRLAKESRGLWIPLLAGDAGSTLFAGNALSGTTIPLAARSHELTLLDPSPERLELARAWIGAAVPRVSLSTAIDGNGVRLPFEDRSFDLVVHESASMNAGREAELARVTRGELALVVDARGRVSWRRFLRELGLSEARTFGPHPDRDDPAQLVALDASLPRFFAGASRRRALLAGAAQRVGLWPRLLRSRVLLANRCGVDNARPSLAAALAFLARELGEPEPEVEHVLGSCGNTCEVFTARRGARAGDPRGRWRLHLPMRPDHAPGIERNHRTLSMLRERHAGVPVPEPLFLGDADGLWLSCERRLAGLPGDLLLRDWARADRVAHQAAEHLAGLVARPAAPFRASDFEREVEPWFERALAGTAAAEARSALEGLRESARGRLTGLPLPRVVVHGDLRAKHVQALRDGRVAGYVHWGVAIDEGLPLLDLFHLLVHARVQLAKQSVGAAWRALRDGDDLRPPERRALERHAELLALPRDATPALALLYPAFVATVGFAYSALAPPEWLARQFEFGVGRIGPAAATPLT